MKYVPYIRVSTKRQGDSGLGLEAQQDAVQSFVGAGEIVAEFREVETGTNKKHRPQLTRALAACRKHGATLLVAKLDRLSRNVAFTAQLMESNVPFQCCDNPNATRLTIHILAAVAEDEARRISERTKAALGAYKRRGGVLGGARLECRNLSDDARAKGREANSRGADAKAAEVQNDVVKLKGQGMTLAAIAETLNDAGKLTRRDKAWTAVAVMRVLDRVA